VFAFKSFEVNFGSFATGEVSLLQYHVVFHCARIYPFDKAIKTLNKNAKIQRSESFIPLSIIMFRMTELRHKRLDGCRKKRLNIGTFF
jgi:hypothetical protein